MILPTTVRHTVFSPLHQGDVSGRVYDRGAVGPSRAYDREKQQTLLASTTGGTDQAADPRGGKLVELQHAVEHRRIAHDRICAQLAADDGRKLGHLVARDTSPWLVTDSISAGVF